MKFVRRLTLLTSILFLLLIAGSARAVNISGTITTTLVITDNSQLVGNVTCEVVDAPCISFGASGITLTLNGFTMTGRADPPLNCATPAAFVPEDGISAINRSNVVILGPGLVQKFRRHGIFLNGNPATNTSTANTVRLVTSNQNCFSGLQMSGVTNSDVLEIVSVRNAIASEQLPCGGNCITNSHNNRIRKNFFSGNGSVSGANGNNDFGAGLVGSSSGNLLEENNIGGNTNGILIQSAAVNNTIQRNIIAGNPPIQVSATFGAAIGFDIRDLSPAGANIFVANHCVTYSGAANLPPCPNVSTVIGTTAAGVQVSGRVTTPQGMGLKNARVWITDSKGSTREVLTNSLGYFSFNNIASGETYVIGVNSRRYRFSTRTIQVLDTSADVDFSALE